MRLLPLLALLACDGGESGDDGTCTPTSDVEDCATPEDDNCDGDDNDQDALGCTTFFLDEDGDTYGGGEGRCVCEPEFAFQAEAGGDCDDADAARNPGATETCDGTDEDCDGETDEDAIDLGRFYPDADGDGWGVGDAVSACERPSGHAANRGDCDDADPLRNAGELERCNGVDDDCDGTTSEFGKISRFTDAAATAHHGDSADLAGAVSATPPGGVIQLCGGSFDVSDLAVSTALTIRGLGGAELNTLQGDGATPVIKLLGGDLVLEGLTITGGFNEYFGGGIDAHASSPASLTVRDSLITGNLAEYGGGIGASTSRAVTLQRVTILENEANAGGGGLHLFDGALSMEDVVIEGNEAAQGGGLVLFTASEASGTGVTLAGNVARDYGGGVQLTDATLSLTDSAVLRNRVLSSSGTGGGAYFNGSLSTLNVTNSDFGTGDDDNSPSDVDWLLGSTPYTTGAGATFTCTIATGCVAP